jgi:ArsR family transcriptional regulator, arsenate/arsenite/antimonite-responsive transcriptional repressor
MVSKQMTPERRAKVFKALSDPRRIEIVEQLARGALCGTALAAKLGISVALLSHHWTVLEQAGILRKVRQGQLRVCSLDAERLREALTMLGPAALSSARRLAPGSLKKRAVARRRTQGQPP